MKKLELKAKEFGAKEMLTRAQLRKVLGGGGGAQGTHCTYSSECISNLSCIKGACEPIGSDGGCVQPGQRCVNTNDCCAGVCEPTIGLCLA